MNNKEIEKLKEVRKEVDKIILHLRAQDRGEITISFVKKIKMEN